MSTEDRKIATEEYHLSTISVTARIPEFWKKSPKTWFIQVEAVLQPQKMSDEAKYQVVISKLGQEVIEQITEILLNPPEKNKYENLKQKLILIYQESEERQVKKLIGEMELGDQKPSQLLRKMQDLARNRVTKETLVVMWQNHLPPSVRGVLAVTNENDLEKLATIADKVMETATPIPSIAAVEGKSPTQNKDDLVIAHLDKISERLEKLESRSRKHWQKGNRRRYRSRSRSSPESRTRGKTPEDPNWLCYYHYRYKNRANKCVQPCNWKKDVKPSEN